MMQLVFTCERAQPQNSLPDVVIWLIVKSSGKRVAYARVPAHDVLYSERPDHMGRLCGLTTTLFLQVCPHTHLSRSVLFTISLLPQGLRRMKIL